MILGNACGKIITNKIVLLSSNLNHSTGFKSRSKSMGRLRQEYTGSHWNMEAVFRPENFRIFSGAFRSLSCAFCQELVGNHRKKNPEIFRLEYCFHVPMTSGVFLQDPAFFPSLSCKFLRDLVTGIFDLGAREHQA